MDTADRVKAPILIGVVASLVLLVAVLVIRRPVQRRLFAGTGWEEWREVAAELPWRDRWSLYVANSLGRAPAPRLALLAVRRGEVIEAAVARTTSRRSALRKVLYAAAVLSLLGLILNLVGYFMDHDGNPWLSSLPPLLTIVIACAYVPLQARQLELVRRSVRRSQELTAR